MPQGSQPHEGNWPHTRDAAEQSNLEIYAISHRLDHNRAVGILANHLSVQPTDVDHAYIWGNHSPTQYPDLHQATVKGQPALDQIDRAWYENDYIPTVAKRGAAIIEARGSSSAASAAQAAIDHMHDWILGSDGQVVSMAVPADGSYGIAPGVLYSYPVICEGGDYRGVSLAVVAAIIINTIAFGSVHHFVLIPVFWSRLTSSFLEESNPEWVGISADRSPLPIFSKR